MTCSERWQDLGDTNCVKWRDDLASFTVCCRLLKEAARLDDGRVEVGISVGEWLGISRDRGETPRLANYRLRCWMVSKILCPFCYQTTLKCTRKREKDVPIAIILIQPCQRGRNWSDGRKNQAIWSFWGCVAMATHSLYICVRKSLFFEEMAHCQHGKQANICSQWFSPLSRRLSAFLTAR